MSESISIGLWNANGLRATVISDIIQYASSFSLLIITETWLRSPSRLPTNWTQYHIYGATVPGAGNRGSGGVCALVSPSCPFPVYQLPSPNAFTLSLKVGPFRLLCLYLSPSMSVPDTMSLLCSLPMHPNTILCGDFNARLGDLTGDSIVNTRGRAFLPWMEERQLIVLNSFLAKGVPTWLGFRDNREMSSIIDLFVTNVPFDYLDSPSLTVAADLCLGSDHRLLCLSFSSSLFSSSPDVHDPSSASLHPRRLWNLSRLQESEPRSLYVSTFVSLSASLQSRLASYVSSPPIAAQIGRAHV